MTERPPFTAALGSEVRGIRLEEVLAIDPNGTLFVGRRLEDSAPAVLQVSPPFADAGALIRARRALLRWAHCGGPGLARMLDVTRMGPRLVTTWTRVRGRSLRSALRAGPPPHGLRQEISARLGAALSALHHAGAAHRNLAPRHVVLTVDGNLCLVNPGLPGLASDPSAHPDVVGPLGHLAYLAPEQINQEPGGGAADIYALSAVLYELWTGHVLPWQQGTPLLERLPAELQPVIRASLAPEPKDRPPLSHLLDALARTEL